jgi:hypothetical protein
MVVLYFPARQAVHAPPAAVYPGSHRHFVAPGSEVVCWAHWMHASEPVWSEYLPASQLAHVEAAVAPTTEENLPASHCWHAADPDVALNFPVLHAAHASPVCVCVCVCDNSCITTTRNLFTLEGDCSMFPSSTHILIHTHTPSRSLLPPSFSGGGKPEKPGLHSQLSLPVDDPEFDGQS